MSQTGAELRGGQQNVPGFVRGVYDHRSLGDRFLDGLAGSNRRPLATVVFACALADLFLPALTIVWVALAMILSALVIASRPLVLPMRLPSFTKQPDPHDPKPGDRGGYERASGSLLLGYEDGTGKPVWAGVTDILRHFLLMGVTGAGKTEALMGLVANALGVGGGVIYGDAKATVKLLWQITALASLTGRIDDLLVVNYITGGVTRHADVVIPQVLNDEERDLLDTMGQQSSGRLSNTAMPFPVGNADGIQQILVSLMPPGGDGGGNSVFRERAIAIMGALLAVMEDLHYRYGMPISPESIRANLDLSVFKDMVDGKYGKLGVRAQNIMREYLRKIPGWDDNLPIAEQPQQVTDQFGFAQMYWTRALSTLADTYGHIYGDAYAEVDYPDVVLNRRIMVLMLPAMEKAPDELGQLAKIVLAGLKGAMAIGLGSVVEGDKSMVLDALPSASSIPTLAIFDEYGYMAAPGFAVAAAQARGLGFGAVFAGQGLAGFKAINTGAGGEIEVKQIIDNTRIKAAMGIEDSSDTFKLFKEIGGEIDITRESSYELNSLGTAIASRKATLQRQSRVEVTDLRGQTMGEAHLFWMHRLIHMHFFYANATLPRSVRLNTGVAVRLDNAADLASEGSVVTSADAAAGGAPAARPAGGADAALPGSGEEAPLSAEDRRFADAVAPIDAGPSAVEAVLAALPGWIAGLAKASRGRRGEGGGSGAQPRPSEERAAETDPEDGDIPFMPHDPEIDTAPDTDIPDEVFEGPMGDHDERALPAALAAAGQEGRRGAAVAAAEDSLARLEDFAAVTGQDLGVEDPLRQRIMEAAASLDAGSAPIAYPPADLDRPRSAADESELHEIERLLLEAISQGDDSPQQEG